MQKDITHSKAVSISEILGDIRIKKAEELKKDSILEQAGKIE